MKTNSYENKVALVTGGTSGIGKATALAFDNAGAKVVVTGRREKEGTEVVAEIMERGGTASFFRLIQKSKTNNMSTNTKEIHLIASVASLKCL